MNSICLFYEIISSFILFTDRMLFKYNLLKKDLIKWKSLAFILNLLCLFQLINGSAATLPRKTLSTQTQDLTHKKETSLNKLFDLLNKLNEKTELNFLSEIRKLTSFLNKNILFRNIRRILLQVIRWYLSDIQGLIKQIHWILYITNALHMIQKNYTKPKRFLTLSSFIKDYISLPLSNFIVYIIQYLLKSFGLEQYIHSHFYAFIRFLLTNQFNEVANENLIQLTTNFFEHNHNLNSDASGEDIKKIERMQLLWCDSPTFLQSIFLLIKLPFIIISEIIYHPRDISTDDLVLIGKFILLMKS